MKKGGEQQGLTVKACQARVKGNFDNALLGLEVPDIMLEICREDGKFFELQISAKADRDPDGKVVGLICFEQKQLESTNHSRNLNYQPMTPNFDTFINLVDVPIFAVNTAGLILEWNNKVAEMTRFSREEVLGKELVEMYIGLDYRASVQSVLSNALQGQVTTNFEFPLNTKDSRCVEVLLNATPRTDASGRIVGMLGVGQDITERKQVEAEKTRIASELQTFIDTANAPIFGIDANGLVNEWNNKSAAITGFSREEVLGRDLVLVRRLPLGFLRLSEQCHFTRSLSPWSTKRA